MLRFGHSVVINAAATVHCIILDPLHHIDVFKVGWYENFAHAQIKSMCTKYKCHSRE